jgi:hypothetical protein
MARVGGASALGLGFVLGLVLLIVNPEALVTVVPAVIGGGMVFRWGDRWFVLLPAIVLVGLSGYILLISGIGLAFLLATAFLVVALAEEVTGAIGGRRPIRSSGSALVRTSRPD